MKFKFFLSKGYIISSVAGCAVALAIFKGMETIFPIMSVEESIRKDFQALTGIVIGYKSPSIYLFSFLLYTLFGILGSASGWLFFYICLKFKELLLKE